MAQIKDGMIILFGESMPQPGAHFRQDNDFYYFTGIEDTVLITKDGCEVLTKNVPKEIDEIERLMAKNRSNNKANK